MSEAAGQSVKYAWVQRVLGVEVKRTGNGASSAHDKAMQNWTSARKVVLASLSSLEKFIRAMNDPLSNDAIILLKAISANLTAVPETPRQIDELKRYLQTDSIIDDAEIPNGFGIDVEIREPLMSALLQIEQSVTA